QVTDRVNKYIPANRKHDDKVVSTLLAFLEWLPDEGKLSFSRDVLACDNDDKLHAVFWNLVTGLLYQMKTTSGKTSVYSSPHEKRKENAELLAAFLPVSHHRDSKFRMACPQRDDYRCVVTKCMDRDHWKKVGRPLNVKYGDLEAAHIIPFTYASWNEIARNAWEVLYRCFPAIRRVGMSIENINDSSNGITLRSFIHSEFGKFRCAFVATETPNVYTFKTFEGFSTDLQILLPEDRIVTIQQAVNSEDVTLPSSTFFDCHHRIAEVLNATGMGQVIEQVIRDWEDLKISESLCTLDSLGRSDVSQILETALWQRVRG
ncbi:hypothetical protein AJ78_05735, partial [Emergomyces pasteurianus Ep9510]